MSTTRPLLKVLALLTFATFGVGFSGGCKSTYYKTMEAFGSEKRDILVSRVKDAREDQQEAKEQFRTALEQFQELVNDDGGNLQKAYSKAKDEYEASKSKAADVKTRIDKVETVGTDLFNEWETELDQYVNAERKRASERQLRETRDKFDDMLKAMRKAESSMGPVLDAFNDQVMTLKHTLNARAVAALRGTVEDLEKEIQSLIRDMERSINEADEFIKEMQT